MPKRRAGRTLTYRAIPRWTRYAAAGLAVALFVYSIPHHALNGDEAWLGEQAYYRAVEGHARSPMFRGVADVERRVVVQHKVLIDAGALAIRLAGWDLNSLRIVALLSALALGVLLVYQGEREGPPGRGWIQAGAFLITPLAFYYGKIFRPEILVTLFAVCTVLALERASGRRATRFGVLAGVSAALAACSHYHGATVIVAGFSTLLVTRRVRIAGWYCAGLVLAAAPHLIEIVANPDLFSRQLFDNPLVATKTSGGWSGWLLSLVNEHKRWFRSPEILVVTVPGLLAFGLLSKEKIRQNHTWYCFWFSLLAAVALITHSKLARYGLYTHPFFITEIVSALTLRRGPAQSAVRRFLRFSLVISIPVAVIVSISVDWSDARDKPPPPGETSARWANHIPAKATVIAPTSFVFDEIGRYDLIAIDLLHYRLRRQFHGSITAAEFFPLAATYNADFIVLPQAASDLAPITHSDGGSGYVPVHTEESAVIFARRAAVGGPRGAD